MSKTRFLTHSKFLSHLFAMVTPVWGQSWRSSTWFTITAMIAALFTDTFLASFIVPILPYILEGRIGLDPSHTQRTVSWLLAGNAAFDVIVRIPLAHFVDKSTSTRGWLLGALGTILLSTITTAAGSSLPVLFISQCVQAVASSIMWVVGYTTVANSISLGNTAKTYAMITMASTLGYSAGPMSSGTLFQLGGYWVAWTSAFVLLGIDMVFRLLMVETKRETDATGDSVTEQDSVSERSALLSTHSDECRTYAAPKTSPNFYRCIFSKVNFVAGIYLSIVFGLLITSFNATIPLHVRDVFGWGGMQSGFMFACLQAPRLVMSPFVGWLKDRVGTRFPTAFGFATLAPLFWLLGVPGSAQFPSISPGNWGSTIYVSVMIFLGIQTTFLNGSGMLEATVAVSELQKEYPGAFGPNGGKSRAVAIVGVAWTLGACIGPLLGGSLNEKFGYYVMNCVVAGICVLSSAVAFLCLPSHT